MILMLARIPSRLGEGEIDESAARARHDREERVEHFPPVQILVEAEMHEITQHPPALRNAEPHSMTHHAAQRVRGRDIVVKERHQIADRGETRAHHLGIAGRMDEFINRAAVVIGRTRDLDMTVIEVAPGQTLRCGARVPLPHPHGQAGLGRVEGGGRIGQRAGEDTIRYFPHEGIARTAQTLGDELVAAGAGDRGAATGGDRERGVQPAGSGGNAGLPPAPQHREPMPHQEPIPALGRAVQDLPLGAAVEAGQRQFAAAVDGIVEQPAIAVGQGDGLQQPKGGTVFHPSAGIARRLVQVDDARVQRMRRIERPHDRAGEVFVVAHRPERGPAERGGQGFEALDTHYAARIAGHGFPLAAGPGGRANTTMTADGCQAGAMSDGDATRRHPPYIFPDPRPHLPSLHPAGFPA